MALQNTQRIQIELDGNPPFEYVVVKQGEKGSRIVEVTLLENKTENSQKDQAYQVFQVHIRS